MVDILPAILAHTDTEYKTKLRKASLLSDWIHIDFVDGTFADKATVPLSVVGRFTSGCKQEAHLMVTKPSLYVQPLISLGFARILLPFETSENLALLIKKIKSAHIQVGLSLNPETDIHKSEPLLGELDSVLLLGVQPGSSGQEFIPATLQKIESLVSLVPPGVRIEVDGGVNVETINDMVVSGADMLCVGSDLLDSTNPEQEVHRLLRSIT